MGGYGSTLSDLNEHALRASGPSKSIHAHKQTAGVKAGRYITMCANAIAG